MKKVVGCLFETVFGKATKSEVFGGLFEVVFEKVAKSKTVPIVLGLIEKGGRIDSAECVFGENFNLIEAGDLDIEALGSFLNSQHGGLVLINLEYLKFGNVTFPNVLVRIYKYDSYFNIDFNFRPQDLGIESLKTFVEELHKYSSEVARVFKLDTFFAGIEPAEDENTRFFTNDDLGPLR